ncbi:CrcB-like protein [Sagittula stellata E-37]|uniref:Fluoride-specific ion channel FluC n=2 Tax=Sagittula stellata TaxID=52603 RepID=A3JXI6_SAGS3|nr:CrcB-like protein [Sagittula stellata E-37]
MLDNHPHFRDDTAMTSLLQVALGGALGASARYMTGLGMARLMGKAFPWGTLTVNIVGSFAMGVLVVVLAHLGGNRFAPFLMIGVLGGFTTFSAFSLDAVTLYERGQLGIAALYVGASVIVSIAALFAGLLLARSMTT